MRLFLRRDKNTFWEMKAVLTEVEIKYIFFKRTRQLCASWNGDEDLQLSEVAGENMGGSGTRVWLLVERSQHPGERRTTQQPQNQKKQQQHQQNPLHLGLIKLLAVAPLQCHARNITSAWEPEI